MFANIVRHSMILFLITALLSSCDRDEYIEEEITITEEEPQENQEKVILGQLFDFDNMPIPDMIVTMSADDVTIDQTVTDEEGQFVLSLEDIVESKVLLLFEKDGFAPTEKQVATEKSISITRNIPFDYCPVLDEEIINTLEGVEMVTISGMAFHENGDPAVNQRLNIRDQGNDWPLFFKPVLVDNNGYWEATVPRDIELVVFLFVCLENISKELGPFSSDTEVEPITDIPGLNPIMLADISSCNDETPISNGVSISFNPENGGLFLPYPLPEFRSYHLCGSDCDRESIRTLFAYDEPSNMFSLEKKQVATTIDFRDTRTCTPLENEIVVILDGIELPVIQESFLQINYFKAFTENPFLFPFPSWYNFMLGLTFDLGEDDDYRMHLHIPPDEFAIGKTIDHLPLFEIAQREGEYEYGNFNGTLIIDKIQDGYAHGRINGTVNRAPNNYPDLKPRPAEEYDTVDRELSIDFKILMID